MGSAVSKAGVGSVDSVKSGEGVLSFSLHTPMVLVTRDIMGPAFAGSQWLGSPAIMDSSLEL